MSDNVLGCGKSCLTYYERETRLAGFDFYSSLLAAMANFVLGQADQPVLVHEDLTGQLGWNDALIEPFAFTVGILRPAVGFLGRGEEV